jgi:hypothetical protein
MARENNFPSSWKIKKKDLHLSDLILERKGPIQCRCDHNFFLQRYRKKIVKD